VDRLVENRWHSPFGQPNPVDREFIGLSDITQFLKQYIRLIGICVVLAVVVAWSYNATTDPIFTARTLILIEPKMSQLGQQQASEVNLSLDTAQVESQIAVMQSEKIATMVISSLGLIDDAAFNRPQNPTIGGRLLRLSNLLQMKPSTADATATTDQLAEFERSRRTMAVFHEGLDIRRVGVSYAIEISFRSRDPETAAKIANATADAFVREQIETKAASAREGGAWLETRLQELRTQMNLATQEAQEFRSRHDYSVRPQEGEEYDEAGSALHGPTLEELEVTADTYRKMYESFLHAYTNSVSQQSYPVADARVITAATAPLYPSAPRPKLVLVFGVLAGIMAGVGVAFWKHTLDRTVRSARQIREEFGLECLGELPPFVDNKRKAAILEVVEQFPQSRFSHSIRMAKTAISLADSAHPIRYLGITAAGGGASKKNAFASNLATLYALSGIRTLVIDARPSNCVPANRPNLDASTREPVRSHSDPITRHIISAPNRLFDILPRAASDARNLLRPKAMQALLADVSAYEMVIVDLPSLTDYTEMLGASSVLDGVILMAEWGKTPLDTLGELVRSMHGNKTRILGVLMTNVRAASRKSRGP
jgi:uncharacterized protein involved in exopolysaccharide biosynthesis/Mrp family chromosome partitioning ATPase